MKKKLFGLLLFPVLSLTYLAGLDVNVSSVAAMDGPSISNEGDAFALIDKSY